MQTVSSSEARNNLAAVISNAQKEPVAIQKQGRNEAVLMSYEEYQNLSNSSVAAFQTLCDYIGDRAASRGLTEEKLAEILSEND